MLKGQITNTGVIPSMASADAGYSSQQWLEQVLSLGVKVVSISRAKGKKSLRRSNGRAGLTDSPGPSAALSNHSSSG
jgi:hypothetical protein